MRFGGFGPTMTIASNCKTNGPVLASGQADRLVIQPVADDDGASIKAAVDAFPLSGEAGIPEPLLPTSLCRAVSDHATESTLRGYEGNFRRAAGPALEAAALPARSVVVGWFQGRARDRAACTREPVDLGRPAPTHVTGSAWRSNSVRPSGHLHPLYWPSTYIASPKATWTHLS